LESPISQTGTCLDILKFEHRQWLFRRLGHFFRLISRHVAMAALAAAQTPVAQMIIAGVFGAVNANLVRRVGAD
jgi:hypothetical protein